jgi:hypothetical protein
MSLLISISVVVVNIILIISLWYLAPTFVHSTKDSESKFRNKRLLFIGICIVVLNIVGGLIGLPFMLVNKKGKIRGINTTKYTDI